ncbi:MAG: phosphatidylserine decarboxylase family protein, partial [Aquaticitalea sp.]
MFHKEGHKIIFLSFVILVISLFLIDHFVTLEWLRKSLMLLFLGVFLLILQFFRNPKRIGDLQEHQALS